MTGSDNDIRGQAVVVVDGRHSGRIGIAASVDRIAAPRCYEGAPKRAKRRWVVAVGFPDGTEALVEEEGVKVIGHRS